MCGINFEISKLSLETLATSFLIEHEHNLKKTRTQRTGKLCQGKSIN